VYRVMHGPHAARLRDIVTPSTAFADQPLYPVDPSALCEAVAGGGDGRYCQGESARLPPPLQERDSTESGSVPEAHPTASGAATADQRRFEGQRHGLWRRLRERHPIQSRVRLLLRCSSRQRCNAHLLSSPAGGQRRAGG
jgi:hypothetical protein